MGRPGSGELRERQRADGTVKYSARVRMDGERYTVDLGDEREGTTRLAAERRLAKVLEEIRLGIWQPEGSAETGAPSMPEPELQFAEVAGRFLEHKRSCQLRDRTVDYVQWALEVHLVPYFARKRPSRITQSDVVAYSDHQIAQRDRIKRLRARGRYLEGPRGGALRELSNASINGTLRVLAQLLDWAAAEGWGANRANPASGWRLREKPRLTAALEADELADLIVAVVTPRPARRQTARSAARAEVVVRLRDEERLPWEAVAERVGLSPTGAMYHHRARANGRFSGDRRRARADEALVAALARSGARVAQLCDLDVRDVDLAHAKFRIADSKTETGVREVDMTAGLVSIVSGYFDSRGRPAPSDPAFPDANGRRRDKDQVNSRCSPPAVELANAIRGERGGAATLPAVTAHALRHTYITLAFEAGYSVPYVMQQVGHADSRTTMRIYATVCARQEFSTLGASIGEKLLGARRQA